jgi:hypothetical protein
MSTKSLPSGGLLRTELCNHSAPCDAPDAAAGAMCPGACLCLPELVTVRSLSSMLALHTPDQSQLGPSVCRATLGGGLFIIAVIFSIVILVNKPMPASGAIQGFEVTTELTVSWCKGLLQACALCCCTCLWCSPPFAC